MAGLAASTRRVQRVQIENAPALDVIRRYDTPDTAFYLDPPCVHSSRGDAAANEHEMSDDEPVELAEVRQAIRGRAVLSGYRAPRYDRLFKN
jgi:DNA adenine methylase